MKTLFFLENSNYECALGNIEMYVKPLIEDSKTYHKSIQSQIDSIIPVPELFRIDIGEVLKLVFMPDIITLTLSYYEESLITDSRSQLLKILTEAGRRKVKNCTYIDMAGMIEQRLIETISDYSAKGVIEILSAIQENNIITFFDGNFFKLNVKVSYDTIFEKELVSISKIINPDGNTN